MTFPHLTATATASLFAAVALSAPALAETDFGGLTIDGNIELNYSFSGPLPGVSILGNADITVPLGGSFGFSLGLDGATDFTTNFYAYYPAVYVDTGFARVSVGIPRSVIDQGYLPEDTYGTASTVGWFLGARMMSQTHQAFILGTLVPLGARVDATFGDTEVGMSYHRTPAGPAVHAVAIAGRHTFGSVGELTDVAVSGGFEYVIGTPASNSLHLGAEATWQRLTGGARYTHMAATDAFVLFGDYAITDRISVDAALTHIVGLGTRTFLSAGGQYDLWQSAYVDANVTVSLDGSASTVYEASLGWEF